MNVTQNIIGRTFHMSCGNKRATCFTFNRNKRFYLATAKHAVESIGKAGALLIEGNGNWFPVEVDLVGYGKNGEDVAVLSPRTLFGPFHQLAMDLKGAKLSEDVYFLGFPYLKTIKWKKNNGFPIPFVKKATISAAEETQIYLDGLAIRGFSGGPIVRVEKPEQVIGIVWGYRAYDENIVDETGKPTSYTNRGNSGVISACSVAAITAITDP